jgi:glutathione synthase/RimK-type ligase-like ATP-grasp enzyme
MTLVKDHSRTDATSTNKSHAAASQGLNKDISSLYNARKIGLTPKSADSALEILFLGDTSFGENYQQRLEESGRENILKSEGYDYPLANMRTILSSADLVVANLETPITDIKNSPFADKKSYVHWTDTVKAPTHLLDHNIHVVSLANNHSFDYGHDGFVQTLDILEQEKIHYFGAGRNQQEASEPFMIEAIIGGLAFSCAIIGAFQESASYRRDYQAYAEGQKGGVNALNMGAVIKSIRAIKAYNPDTFVIIFPHWGYNYEWKSAAQIKEAKALIDNGADLILGHGAHMLQELESYKNKWTAFSIGNFMFNSPGRYEHYKAPPYGMIAKLIIKPQNGSHTLACRFYPIVTDNKTTRYQNTFVSDRQFNEVCQLLADKNSSTSTFIHSLARNKDEHGHYLELPINIDRIASSGTINTSSNRVGLICNIRDGVIPGLTARKWMYRAVSMNETLKKQGIELFIYAYNQVDPDTETVRGYVIENNKFVRKEGTIPAVNYDWFLGQKVNVHKHNLSYTQFADWAAEKNIQIYPNKAYIALSKDKFISYKTIAEFNSDLAIYTEIYSNSIEQIQTFLKKSPTIFIKPQFGNSGIGIIVIKKHKDKYGFNYYDKGQEASLTFDSLAAALGEANKIIGKQPYVIQNGVNTAKIDSSTFDIRLVVIGNQNSWDIITEVRLGAKESDLSNVAQGGSCIELDDLLNRLSYKTPAETFKKRLLDTAYKLTSFLDAYYPSHMMEMAYDIIVDTNHKIHITEINCKPGSPMIFTSFNNMFNLNEDEKVLYNKYIVPHGTALANSLKKRLLEPNTEQQDIWFDTIAEPLKISHDDKDSMMQEIYAAIHQRRPLQKTNLPRALTEDKAARILFLSISNGFTKAQVAKASGLGIVAALEHALTQLPWLFKENYQPIWMKLDIVTESTTHYHADLKKAVNFDRSLYGIAFNKDTDTAFLPEQLNAYTLITSSGYLHFRNIEKYISANPYLYDRYQKLKGLDHSTVHQFKTDSSFFNGTDYIPLYRGHRLYESISTDILLDSIDSAVDYLLRSIDLNGKFNYSYESKIDRSKDNYNILRHSGTLYSMLEVYELNRADKILAGAQRVIHYLIKQMKEVIINHEPALVVVEVGHVKLGGNALAVLALAKYIQVSGDKTYLPIIQRLGAWILNTQNEQGDFTIHKQAYNGEVEKDFISEYYPGETLFALARLYQLDPQQKWLNSAMNGALFLINVRDKDLPEHKLIHDHWLLYALNEINSLQPNETLVTHAMKTANTIINSQHTQSKIRDWIGGYYNPPRSTPTATRIEGLCASYRLERNRGDQARLDKILATIKLGIAFQLQTQFQPESAMYLPNPQCAMGGFHHSLTDFEIRIDYVQHNISSLLGLYHILNLA